MEDWTGGLLCNPPFLRGGERERGGIDLEAEGRHAEVQKERERAEDWTLKWRGGRRKYKRSEIKCTPYSGHAYMKLFT